MSSAAEFFSSKLRLGVESLGKPVVNSVHELGSFLFFLAETFRELFRRPFRRAEIVQQMEFIGNQSLAIIVMSAFAIGAVFALLIGQAFQTFNAEGLMGIATAKALTRELAPVMTSFLITGRGGSAVTAELATMKVNEQVDAMESMGVSPIHYLVVPRMVAFMLMMPLLSGIFVFIGIFGSFIVGVLVFDVDQGLFFHRMVHELAPSDIALGFKKAFIMSIVISLIACMFGLRAKGGAKGVGQATTKSVIVTMLTFLLIDFVFSFVEVRLND